MNSLSAIVRTPLLSARLSAEKPIDRIEAVNVELPPGQKTVLHIHQGPVTGYVVSGSIRYQIEGKDPIALKAGDAFFEPAQTRIKAFDNASATERATFVAFYLLGKTDQELITFVR